jgi:hypothetical protein
MNKKGKTASTTATRTELSVWQPMVVRKEDFLARLKWQKDVNRPPLNGT